MGEDVRLRVEVDTADGVIVVRLDGELDVASALPLQTVLAALEESAANVCLDLRGLQFLDSSGLRIILGAHRQLAPVGELYLRCRPGAVRRALRISGVDQVLRVEDLS
jgi:anti-anti-sigma factor